MNINNSILLEKHKDILSFRDLSLKTVATYTSYLTAYILWVEEHLPDRPLSSVSELMVPDTVTEMLTLLHTC